MFYSSLNVRDLQKQDIPAIASYWSDSDPEFLKSMGVDLAKLHTKEKFTYMLEEQLKSPLKEKNSYALIWEVDGNDIGHCNVDKINFGKEAFLHLHIWKNDFRRKGVGSELLRRSLPYFFENLHLKNIYSEPYALNPAPHNALERVGFEFEKEYTSTPGYINFEQAVKRWRLSRERFYKNQNQRYEH